jgi:hypothetical protein
MLEYAGTTQGTGVLLSRWCCVAASAFQIFKECRTEGAAGAEGVWFVDLYSAVWGKVYRLLCS